MKGIKAAMVEKGITIEMIALALCIHRNTASNKVNGESPFYVEEALFLQENLFPEYTLRYLFLDKKETSQGRNP